MSVNPLDLNEEIRLLINPNPNETPNPGKIINSVVTKITDYNNSISSSETTPSTIPEYEPICINELHYVMMSISSEYRNTTNKTIVLFQLLKEFFLSKLVEDNDTLYDEIMNSPHIISFKLVKRICIILKIKLNLIFQYEDMNYMWTEQIVLLESEPSNPNQPQIQCNIHYKIKENKVKMNIVDNNFVDNVNNNIINIVESPPLKNFYNYYKVIKIKNYYSTTQLYEQIRDYENKIVNLIREGIE